MSLNSAAFLISKGGEGLNNLVRYIEQNIGYNVFLIKSIQASILNDTVTTLSLIYNTHEEDLVNSISPREGYILSTGITSGQFGLKLLFTHPIDYNVPSGVFTIDNTGITQSDFVVDNYSNGYSARVNLSGFTGLGSHSYLIDNTKLYRQDRTTYPYATAGGYVFHTNASSYLGERRYSTFGRPRGKITADVIYLSKNEIVQSAIDQYLKLKNIPIEFLVSFTSVARPTNIIELYIVYVTNPEPQIVSSYPLNHSLIPYGKAPSEVTLVFSTELDSYQTVYQPGLFAIEYGFTGSIDISSDDLTLLEDRRTLIINTAPYLKEKNIYTIVVKPGLVSAKGFSKEKPDNWTVVIDDYLGGSGAGDAGMVDVMRRISFRGMGA
jgi:hypothetical protein